MRERLGPHAEVVQFVGEGEQGRVDEPAEGFFGTATRLDQLERERWENIGRVEVVEGPTRCA